MKKLLLATAFTLLSASANAGTFTYGSFSVNGIRERIAKQELEQWQRELAAE